MLDIERKETFEEGIEFLFAGSSHISGFAPY